MPGHFFFDGWTGPLRTLVIGVFAYVMLILFLRLSGKRTLSKMNAFDFVVIVALGSTLASILLTRDVTLLQGGVALAVLIGLQFLVTWSSVRMSWVRRLLTEELSLLLFRGELMAETRAARVSPRTRCAPPSGLPAHWRVCMAVHGHGACHECACRSCRPHRSPPGWHRRPWGAPEAHLQSFWMGGNEAWSPRPLNNPVPTHATVLVRQVVPTAWARRVVPAPRKPPDRERSWSRRSTCRRAAPRSPAVC